VCVTAASSYLIFQMEKIAIVEETEKKKKKKFNRRMRMKTIEKAPITIRNKFR